MALKKDASGERTLGSSGRKCAADGRVMARDGGGLSNAARLRLVLSTRGASCNGDFALQTQEVQELRGLLIIDFGPVNRVP